LSWSFIFFIISFIFISWARYINSITMKFSVKKFT
jgi:hypothetical protein